MTPAGRAGQRAVLPAAGWKAATRRDGCVVRFISEDGSQQLRIDLSDLPVAPRVQEQFAIVLEAASGPAGTWKRATSVLNFVSVAKEVSQWIATAHPRLDTLAALGRSDARLLARSFVSARRLSLAAAVVRYSPDLSPDFKDEFARHRLRRVDQPDQPYTAAELDRICVMARGIIRQGRDRITTHRALAAQYRAGNLDADRVGPGRIALAEALDYCVRHHDLPRFESTGTPSMLARRVRSEIGGRASLMSLIHPTAQEMWAFAVLLAAQAGLNRSVIEALRVPRSLASAPGEAGLSIVNTYKPRRQARAHGTLPLTAYPPELREAGAPAAAVPNTSLNAPFGVFALLVHLTEPGRQVIGSDRAFIFHVDSETKASRFRVGFPGSDQRRRQWTEPWLNGDECDQVLRQVNFNRLRKTRLMQAGRPIQHTPDTYMRYVRNMRPVIEDGFTVVRDALQAEVGRAMARREMTVILNPSADEDAGVEHDTVLGNCRDFSHSPLDNGQACQRTFLSCLDCRNARALPRHLPLQLLVVDKLIELRGGMKAEDWIARHAGQLAQLDDVLSAYTSAQRDLARASITPAQRRIVDQLFRGSLDPA